MYLQGFSGSYAHPASRTYNFMGILLKFVQTFAPQRLTLCNSPFHHSDDRCDNNHIFIYVVLCLMAVNLQKVCIFFLANAMKSHFCLTISAWFLCSKRVWLLSHIFAADKYICMYLSPLSLVSYVTIHDIYPLSGYVLDLISNTSYIYIYGQMIGSGCQLATGFTEFFNKCNPAM